MAKILQSTTHTSDSYFRLKPLVACIRRTITGGVLVGLVGPAYAELPVPLASGPGFVSFGSATNQVIGNTLRVDQQSDKAILNWETFNVGNDNTVQYVQPNSSSIALNRIYQQDPSRILGTITANGQIYLVNKNGFVFDKNSVVNVNTLVASALNISDDAFDKGIIRVFDQNRGNQTLDQAALTGQAQGLYEGVKADAEIKVEAGAKIQAAKNGNIILAAPTVSNSGSIAAGEKGQILLVASKDKVYLQPASSDSPFAGLMVEVGSGGKVTNKAGADISVRQGNVTLAGFAVNQEGRIKATTAVSANGSIRLLAREKAEDSLQNATFKLRATKTDRNSDLDGLGKESAVTFGEGSSTEIVADADGGSAIDEQAQKQSYIEVSANKIHMKSGSSIVAPSAKANLTATNNLTDPLTGNSGRIHLEKGSRIDVSGTKNVQVDMARNVADISVQSFNLRDAPYQRGGVLQGETVKVDIRKTTKILDASGGPASIKRGIDERLGKGGEINLTASGDLIVNNGAVADISGGSVSYRDGFVNTTKLLTAAGTIVDIHDADPNETYAAIYGIASKAYDKWGITETWNTLGQLGMAQFERGYTEGQSAGSLNIQSPLTSWNGQVIAGSVSSIYQLNTPVSGGAFTVNSIDNAGARAGLFLSSQNVLFQTQQAALETAFTDAFPKKSNNQAIDLVLPSALVNQSGLSAISVKTGGTAVVPADTALSMPVLSKLVVDATNMDIRGSIYSAGGTIELNSVNTGSVSSGKINLAGSSVVDVSGRWVNDYQSGLAATANEPAIIDAGTVKIKASNELNVAKGARIKADGGARLASDGADLSAGKGGSISLTADAGTNTLIPGVLRVNGEVSAYGLFEGGQLTLSSNKINVGPIVNESNVLNLGISNGSFDFAPNFGFSRLDLKSNLGGITVKSPTDLTLMTQNRVLTGNYRDQAGANSIAGFSQFALLPEHLRNPVTLALDGRTAVTMETGSAIRVDKESTVNISTTNEGQGIYLDGLIDAPAGQINLKLEASNASVPYNPGQSIWLGSNAYLATQGTSRLNPADAFGRISGEVLNGGTVTANAERGYVIFEQGSKTDVSGASAILDLPVSNVPGLGLQYGKQTVGSDAGKISVTAAEGIVLDGAFNAKAGASNNRGGRFDLTLDRNQRDEQGAVFPNNDLHIDVVQNGQNSLAANTKFGSVIPGSLNGAAKLSSDEIAQPGFDNVRLVSPLQVNTQKTGEVRFLGNVDISAAGSISIDAQTIRSGLADGSQTGMVNLNTAYLQLGSSTIGDIIGTSALGGGSLTTNALWTQLTGASLLTGFKQVNLNSVHDLRAVGFRLLASDQRAYTGNFSTAADVNLAASQIYPSTLSNYTFAVTSPNGKLTVAGRNTDATPLSAAGKLVVNAPVIEQKGVLKAPLGTIELNAASSLSFGKDSLTSVAADGKTVPLGVIANNVWKYPLESIVNLVFNEKPDNATLGEKHLVFNAPDIEFKPGSTVDVSGGGDLLAYEFQPGPGGSFDYLAENSASYQGGFAILPSLGSPLAPYDHFLSADFAYEPGAKVYLSGTGTLPAGEYTILPARYALLPGAYLVTPQAGSRDQITTNYTKSELPVVSGYLSLAGTNVRDARRSGFLVETGEQVKKRSEYNIQTATRFFSQQALAKNISVPLLPADSGQVSIQATSKLILDGQFNVASNNGRGAKMDIAAQQIKVVNKLSTVNPAGVLEILDQDLSNLRVDSLLLGGSRRFDNVTGTTRLTVLADDVVFDQGAQVQALDLVAAGKNSVQVKKDAVLDSSGEVNTGDTIFNVTGDSALLRLSADKQITLSRSASPGTSGRLVVEQGAVLKASESMLLDASKATLLGGNIDMQGGSLSLSANSINIGEIGGESANSLNLSNQKLLSFTVDELALTSRGSINFYGNVGDLDGNGVLAPIKFNRLLLDTAQLAGFDNNGKASRLQADTLVLQNSKGAAAGQAGSGTGTLDLIAKNYEQGGGNFAINGFATVNMDVDGQFAATGNSVLAIAADLNLTAGLITTKDGYSLDIDAGSGAGHNVVINGNANAGPLLSDDFGGSVSVGANAITLNNAKVLLPSGTLKLQAQSGDILVNGQSDINLAGRAVNFADTLDYTPGGTFSADAKAGKIILAAASGLDVSTGGGAAAGGDLIFKAPAKTLELLGSIKAVGASALIDVANFASTNFDDVMGTLAAAGVSDSLYFRTRNADIVQAVGNEIKANALTLAADKGAIDIAGTLNADGAKEGGSISLSAGNKITLESSALLTAKGAGKGGDIRLSSVDSLAANASGIEIKSGATVDVSGADAGEGGDVTLSAARTAGGVNIKAIAGTVKGYNRLYVQGVKKYSNGDLGNDGKLDSSDIVRINAETASYMNAAAQNVAGALGSAIRLRPGVEIDYDGDLTLASAWDFAGQRFGAQGAVPGSLTVRATGDLKVNNSVTDGFTNGVLQSGDSWSFQLVAGADQNSADKLAAAADRDLTIAANTSVHTGTGNIELASGGDVILTDQTSTVYNAGRADSGNRYGTLDGVQTLDYSLPGEPFLTTEFLNGEYPIDGGNLVIRAGSDIKGASSDQFINAWLKRQGNFFINNFADQNHLTAWAVDAAQFQQNIGSFGGGTVDIAATGHINDLSVMMPTTGKQQGLDFNNNNVAVNGGGQMRVKAGGDITGGAYFLGKGEGNISAGGEIKESTQTGNPFAFTQGPQIIMSGDQNDAAAGDSRLALSANQGVKIGAVSDAMVLNPNGSEFFTYGEKSALAVKSLSGDVHLNADIRNVSQTLGIVNEFNQLLAAVYPGSLDATAFNGSIKLDQNIILFPSAVGSLNILAKQAISSSNGPYNIIMSDADPALLPSASAPVIADFSDDNLRLTGLKFDPNSIFNNISAVRELTHAVNPVHAADSKPARLVTQDGDISSVQINLPKQAIIQAGRDLKNSSIQIQQINSTDASIISAGRDLIFETGLTSDGLLDRTKTANKIEIAGPGDVTVKTGRNLDLGSSVGISTVGNLFNTNLASQGASLDVLVGLNAGNPDYAAFIGKYQTNSLYADKLNQAKAVITGFMRQRSGNEALAEADALEEFRNLKGDETLAIQPQLNALLTQVFFNELKVAGSASAADKAAGNEGGFAAIDTLFPGTQWQGDLTLFFSKLHTIAGGDINLLVPGGEVNAGLAVAPGGAGSKKADELGIVAQKQGQINAFVKDDFIVNTSRVFTLGGGDVLIWSSEGDIDAGKGAKSALSVTVDPPFFDSKDQLVVPAPKITNGSGIRTASSGDSSGTVSSERRRRFIADQSVFDPGDVYLIAPRGIVNAGEAGIAGNNVTISATAVLGANNIQVGGVGSGVPVAATGSVAAGLTGTGNLTAGVTQVAENSLSADTDKDSLAKNAMLGMLSVDILGFGE